MKCDREGCTMPLHGYAQTRVIDGTEYHFCCSSCLSVFYRLREQQKRKGGDNGHQ